MTSTSSHMSLENRKWYSGMLKCFYILTIFNRTTDSSLGRKYKLKISPPQMKNLLQKEATLFLLSGIDTLFYGIGRLLNPRMPGPVKVCFPESG